jgi:hypothetical protein
VKTIIALSLVILICFTSKAQDSTWTRNYEFGVFNQNDLRNSSSNAISANRVLTDVFRKGVSSKMNEKLGNALYGFYSFSTTYLTMVWSHEFGHSLRANQVGGEFRIHNAALPIPYTTMHLPEDISLVDEALSVTGGFEVNYLTVRKIQREFVEQNGTFAEDLSFSFANRMMFPIYTSVIVPLNAEEPNVWIETAGDPVHCVLPVFKNFSNNQVFMPDGTVNPGLVKMYGQSALFASFFSLLDPQFYRELGGAFGKMDKTRRPIFLIGNYDTGWTYGTLFNMSPLGYELYMNNYIHVKGHKFSIYAKYGNPFKNNGLGIRYANIVDNPKLNISSTIDLWDQDIFGKGVSGEVEAKYKISEKFGVNMSLGYKTEGYVLGKQLKAGLNLGFGLAYYANY